MFILNRLSQAKAWGYLLPPLRGEIKRIVVPRNLVAMPNLDTSGEAPLWQVELKCTTLGAGRMEALPEASLPFIYAAQCVPVTMLVTVSAALDVS